MSDNKTEKRVCGICLKKLRNWKPVSQGGRKDWTGRRHHLSCWKMLQNFHTIVGYKMPFDLKLARILYKK